MAATKLLANTLKNVLMDPVEGFTVELVDESNMFEWKVFIEGPKDTLYEGGIFQLNMKFPADFPMSPPELRFMSDFWHPNVYRDTGLVCISILHPPVEDETSGESAAERWFPTQTVTTIILSVISLLNSPNFSSPANVDASVEWRNDPIGYKKKCQKLVDKANVEKPANVVIPHPDTNKEERERQIEKMRAMNKPIEMDDFMNELPDVSEDTGSDEEQESEASSESKEEKKVENPKSNSKKNHKNDSKNESKKEISENDTNSIDEEEKEKPTKRDEKRKDSTSQARDPNSSQSSKKKNRRKKKCIIM